MALIGARSVAAARAGPRHRRDRRPRCGDDRHARQAADRRPRQRHRSPPGPGPRFGPRPDAADRSDGGDRRGALSTTRSKRPSLRRRRRRYRRRSKPRPTERPQPSRPPANPAEPRRRRGCRCRRAGSSPRSAVRSAVPNAIPTATTIPTTTTPSAAMKPGAVVAPAPTPASTGRCHSDDRVGTAVGGTIAPRNSPAARPPRVGGIVDRPARGEPERDVDQHQDHQLAHDPAALPVDRVVDPAGREQDPEQAEDRARGARPTERRRRRRSSRSSRPRRRRGRTPGTGSIRTSARRSCPTARARTC